MKNHNQDPQRRKSPSVAQQGGHILEGVHLAGGKLLLHGHGGCNLKCGVDHLSSGASGVGSVVAFIFLELSISWGSACRVCSNIGKSLPGSP